MSSGRLHTKKPDISICTLVVLVSTALVFYFLMTIFTSPHIDDLHYGYPYRHWLLGEGDFPGFDPWWRTIKAHFFGINGRFGDKLLLGYLMLPKWVAASVASVCSVGFMFFSARIATGDIRRHGWLSTAVIIALILSLPWYDSMFLGCMTVNYIMASFWGLAALSLYFRPSKDMNEGRDKAIKYCGATVLGFLAGSWHECFTFIMAPGLLLYPLFVKRLSKLQISILIGGILGGLFIISNPGFWVRYDNQMHLMTMKRAMGVFYYANGSLLFLLVFPVFMSIKKLRRRYSRSEMGIMTACAIALILNIVIFLSNLDLPRVTWFGMIMGYIGLAILLLKIRPGRKLFMLCKVAVAGGVLFCIVHFYVTVITQYRVDREYRAVIDLYRTSKDGTVFYTEKVTDDMPWIALARPYYDQFRGWKIDAGTDTFYKTSHVYLNLVPECLKDFTPENSDCVNESQGVYIFEGNCVVDSNKVPYSRWHRLQFQAEDGNIYIMTLLCHKFKTPDSREWFYVQPSGHEIRAQVSVL